ncbi:MAG: hypothetical protein WBW33_09420 [Bryobacteraceae bacterium]
MSEHTTDEAKTGNTAANPGQSEVVEKIEKEASRLTEDELSKIAGGLHKPDQY